MLRNVENYTYPSKETNALSSSGTAEGGFLFQSRTADQHRASKGAIRQSALHWGWGGLLLSYFKLVLISVNWSCVILKGDNLSDY